MATPQEFYDDNFARAQEGQYFQVAVALNMILGLSEMDISYLQLFQENFTNDEMMQICDWALLDDFEYVSTTPDIQDVIDDLRLVKESIFTNLQPASPFLSAIPPLSNMKADGEGLLELLTGVNEPDRPFIALAYALAAAGRAGVTGGEFDFKIFPVSETYDYLDLNSPVRHRTLIQLNPRAIQVAALPGDIFFSLIVGSTVLAALELDGGLTLSNLLNP